MKPQQIVSNDIARKLAVYKQGLHQRPKDAKPKMLKQIVRQIGVLQLDSISVTARSHYLVMLSRAGLYDVEQLDALLPQRFLFEQWAHAACLIPIEDYPYFEPIIHARRERENYSYNRLGDDPQAVLNGVLEVIREKGPLSSKAFESPRGHKGSWWNWKPAKIALEILFDHGYLMASHRENFHRYYDLSERVLNGAQVSAGKTLDDYRQWAVVNGLRNQGIATTADIADYYRIKKTPTEAILKDLVKQGEVIPLTVEGWTKGAYIHKEDWSLVEAIEGGKHEPHLTTFLSPFDNLIWFRERDERMFNFFYRVEMYTPGAKRTYGYYVLPILHNGKLVGRIDPKIDRKTKCFIIRQLHLEAGVVVTDELMAGLTDCVREFMVFHDCVRFEIGTSTDEYLKTALVRAIG